MSQLNPIESAQAGHAAKEENLSFEDEFKQILGTLARPMFEDFASDSRANGYPAEVESGKDEQGNYFTLLKFILDRAAFFDVDLTNECKFVIKGLVAEEKIELHGDYDQRPGKEGAYHGKFDIQQINQLGLEDELTDFLSAAMASRKGEPIPPRKKEAEAAAAAKPPAAAVPIPIIWKARPK